MPNPKKPAVSPGLGKGIVPFKVIDGPSAWVARISFSPDGEEIAIASQSSQIEIRSTKTGKLRLAIPIDTHHIYSAAWSPDGKMIASTQNDRFIRIWDATDGQQLKAFEAYREEESVTSARRRLEHWKMADPQRGSKNRGELIQVEQMERDGVREVAWSPDGGMLASGDEFALRIWDFASGAAICSCHREDIISVSWSPDGRRVASTSYHGGVVIYDVAQKEVSAELRSGYSAALAWSPDGKHIVSGHETAVHIWNASTSELVHVLEGHNARVRAVCFSSDGRFFASKAREESSKAELSSNAKVLFWRTDTWQLLGIVPYKAGGYIYSGLAFSPAESLLASSGAGDRLVHLIRYDSEVLLGGSPPVKSVYYKNAKIALVGDSGVGKSGLALAIAGKQFIPTESTHGRKIAVIKRQRLRMAEDKREVRELILWDLAGQPGYRLIHQLHLEDVSVAVILFDSRSELDPFAGVRYWNRVLAHAAKASRERNRTMSRILVAARIDRGGLSVGMHRIVSVVHELHLDSFIATSAKEGTGVEELRAKVEAAVDWDAVPSVTSNVLFQSIKIFLTKEKRAGRLLATVDELLRTFQRVMPDFKASADLRESFTTCIGRLQSLGLVRRFSFGNFVLLQPEIIDSYASSIIFAAKQEPDGMGSILEEDVRVGKFPMPEDSRLADKEQEKLLLLATTEDLLAHEIAFREPTDHGQLLIFPSQLTRENPELPDPPGKEAVFEFEGPILNIYATLIVRLAHSNIFRPREMWKNAVVFAPGVGGSCGVYVTEADEGRGTMTLFYSGETIPEVRQQFDDYIQSHLYRRALPNSVRRSRVLVCSDPNCATPISSDAIEKRLARGFDQIRCVVCDAVITLTPVRKPTAVSRAITMEIDSAAAHHKMVDTALVSASAEMQTSSFRRWAGSDQTTIALVFTDVVGSTALGDELGDEQMGYIRRSHFEQTRKLIARHLGYEIKTIGDSFMVAFRTVIHALDFGLDIFAKTGHKDVRVRVGIHVGPVRVEEEDAFGNMVNYAARVVGWSKNAEIWMSDRAHTDILLEKSKSHQKLEWNKHQECELKGFKEKQILWSTDPR